MKFRIAMIAVLGAALAMPAWAQKSPAADHAAHQGSVQAQPALADGEIRKVDKDAKKITIKHGPLPTLDMPAMTMVFQVKDPTMLDQVKAGDKVKFEAQKLGGAYTVTKIEAAK
jgi:Cu/Ag efflux protein CusF